MNRENILGKIPQLREPYYLDLLLLYQSSCTMEPAAAFKRWTYTPAASHTRTKLAAILEKSGELQGVALACITARKLSRFDRHTDSTPPLPNTQEGVRAFLSRPVSITQCRRLLPVLCSSLRQALKESDIDSNIKGPCLTFLQLR